MIIIPVRLIYGFFRGVFTGDWEVFRGSLRFWSTCLGVIVVLGLIVGIVSAVSVAFNNPMSRSAAPPSQSQQTLVQPTTQSVPQDTPTPQPTEYKTAQSFPTYIWPTPTPQAADDSIRIQIVFYPTAKHLYVCADVANVRRGPGTTYSVAYQPTRNTPTKATGYISEWFYVGYDKDGTDLFMHQSVLCDSVTQSHKTQPAPTSAANSLIPDSPFSLPTPGDWLAPNPSSSPSQPVDSGRVMFAGTPKPRCQDYASVPDFRDCPIRGITRPNGVKVYFVCDFYSYFSKNECTDPNEKGVSTYFANEKEAEAAGFVTAHPK